MDLSNLGIANLILLVVPGFVSDRVYRSSYPAKADSDWALAGSVLISTVWIFLLVKVFEHFGNTPLLDFTANAIPDHKTLLVLLVAGYVWGYTRVLWHFLKFKTSKKFNKLSFIKPDLGSVWAELNNMQSNEWVKIVMSDGSMYLGWVSNWSRDPDKEEFDFLLKDAKRVDEYLSIVYEVQGAGLYVKSSSVLYIEYCG